MSSDSTDAVWQWIPSLVVVIASVFRLGQYIRRRRDQRFRTWEPAELTFVRMLVVLITGRPVSAITWKRIDTLVLTLLLLAVAVGFRKSFDNFRSGSTSQQRSTSLGPDG